MSNNLDFMRLVAAIINLVNLGRVSTIPQLQQLLKPYFNVYGSAGLAARANPKIIFWAGMSELFMRAIEWLLDEGEIGLECISPFFYFCDRFYLDIPPIDSQRVRWLLHDWDEYARIIEKPTWLPAVLTPKGVTVQDLLQEPLTPSLLQTVLDKCGTERIEQEEYWHIITDKLDSADAGAHLQDMFETLVS